LPEVKPRANFYDLSDFCSSGYPGSSDLYPLCSIWGDSGISEEMVGAASYPGISLGGADLFRRLDLSSYPAGELAPGKGRGTWLPWGVYRTLFITDHLSPKSDPGSTDYYGDRCAHS